jgi:hypothetical protein
MLALAAGPTVRATPQGGQPDLVLEIGVNTYRSDGSRTGRASNGGVDTFSSHVSGDAGLCWLSAGSQEPRTAPAVSWQFSGRVLRRAGDELLVQVDWRRTWDNSTRVIDGPKGSLQLSIRNGEWLVLDDVVPLGLSPCDVARARLEATVVARPSPSVVGQLGAGVSASGGGWGGRTGGGGSGTGAGGRVATAAESPPLFDAEIWLVHHLPGGSEDPRRQTVSFGARGTDFTFPVVRVETPRGEVTVEVTGRLQSNLPAERDRRLLVIIARRTRTAGPPPLDNSGGTSKSIALPAPTEVVSFELPPVREATDVLAGHRFSLRLRVTPR